MFSQNLSLNNNDDKVTKDMIEQKSENPKTDIDKVIKDTISKLEYADEVSILKRRLALLESQMRDVTKFYNDFNWAVYRERYLVEQYFINSIFLINVTQRYNPEIVKKAESKIFDVRFTTDKHRVILIARLIYTMLRDKELLETYESRTRQSLYVDMASMKDEIERGITFTNVLVPPSKLYKQMAIPTQRDLDKVEQAHKKIVELWYQLEYISNSNKKNKSELKKRLEDEIDLENKKLDQSYGKIMRKSLKSDIGDYSEQEK